MIDNQTEVPAAMLAQALGLTRPRIEQLRAAGVLTKTGRGRFPLISNVTNYVAWLRNEQRRAAKSGAREKLDAAKAADIAARTAEREGRSRRLAEQTVIELIDEIAGPLRSDVLAIPARVTADITLRRKIEDQIEEAFGAMSDRADKVARKSQTGPASIRKKPMPKLAQ